MKKTLYALFIISAIFIGNNTFYGQKTHVFSWKDYGPNYQLDNVTPFCWVGTTRNFSKRINLYTDIDSIKKYLDIQPVGKRTLASINLHKAIDTNYKDYLKDEFGMIQGYIDTFNVFQPFPPVWCDSGATERQAIFDTMFRKLSETGAQIDMFVLDDETFVSNWSLQNRVNGFRLPAGIEKSAILQNYYDAIDRDARSVEMFASLGFDTLDKVNHYLQNDTMYLIFNEYFSDKKAGYIDTAIYAPLKKYYPNARFSNYSNSSKSEEFPVPDFNGHKIYCCGSDGNHVGTHQAKNFYGLLGSNFNGRDPFDFDYAITPFHALLLDINKMRSMVLGDVTPVIPWVAFHSFANNAACRYSNNDFYIENIYHLLLSGADDLLLWNGPVNNVPDFEETILVSNVVIEYDSLLAKDQPYATHFYNGNGAAGNDLSNWQKNYLLTGQESDSTKLWRLTVDTVTNLEIINSATNPPLRFIVYNDMLETHDTLAFPNAYIFTFTDVLSEKGYWIVENKKPPVSLKTGISETTVFSAITINPNPTNGVARISISDATIKFQKLELYNLIGDLIAVSNQPIIDLSTMNKGIYLVKISTDMGTSMRKVVLE